MFGATVLTLWVYLSRLKLTTVSEEQLGFVFSTLFLEFKTQTEALLAQRCFKHLQGLSADDCGLWL